ncbi:SDR family NAD(P)-dependent oxidoreductase [Metabacillus arenae]|uniref:SDR family oxidoreductase n=1 Tax=Metabacillus arenae TaxID=2771434 RepID=A0A926NHQ7_9BACI|nr:SDR family oxidoreductase [Metabacillus arenae]MBD1381506.1 SDR family oxidoreductase [Metabacillus arenae]
MRVKDKCMIVTGADGGMGKAVTKRMLDEGATIIGLDLYPNGTPLDQPNCFFIAADLTKADAVEEAFVSIDERVSKLDGLVNLIGYAQQATPIEEVTDREWRNLIDVNTSSIFYTCKEAVKRMKKVRSGSIVNVASISAERPRPGLQAYIASKGAVVSLTKGIAIEAAEYGIRANVIHPGPCDTKMLSQFVSEGTNIDEAKDEIFKKSVPMGRLIAPEDIANASLFLCSDESEMVTGTVLHVDGGRGL